ncbi:MAG: NAD(P)/FAD-dependent oxidoreductase [Candidatus Nitrosocosmicus sp.]
MKGKRIVILGGGFGGLASASILRDNLSKEHQITVIDKKDHFIMGFVNLWILNGNRNLEESKIALSNLENKGISFLQGEITKINLVEKIITMTLLPNHDHTLEYDYLIISLGSDYNIEQIDGLAKNKSFNLYDSQNIPNLRKEILALRQGKIAICITDIPYKCPPAPYEASLLVNTILLDNNTRGRIDVDVFTPSPIALPVAGPKVSQDVVNLIEKNHIGFHPSYRLKSVSDTELYFEYGDGNKKSVSYDILIFIPPHKLPSVIKSSDLIENSQRWINVDKYTLKTKYENVYAIGDVTEIKVNSNVSVPKAGIFAEGQAKVVCHQIIGDIKNDPSNSKFDGRGFCFMEIGNSKAGFIDTDFYDRDGPVTRLDPPTEESYERKISFEKSRINKWLLSTT